MKPDEIAGQGNPDDEAPSGGRDPVPDHPSLPDKKGHPHRLAVMNEFIALGDRSLVDLHGLEKLDFFRRQQHRSPKPADERACIRGDRALVPG